MLALPQSIGSFYASAERAAIDRAAALARAGDTGLRTPEGEDLAHHVVGVADILASLKLDHESIVAALLLGYPAPSPADQDALRADFGATVAMLVDGVARMGQIHNDAKVLNENERTAQAERLRKMLLAMVDDIRIVLIKLAERVQTLRFLANANAAHGDTRQTIAKEVLELFAPLANRLGVWQFKWELEDLSLRVLEPDAYKSIARALDERRHDRESYIRKVMATLATELATLGIHADVAGRPKHIYSIYKKMKRKGSGIDGVYDIRAVRVLVDDIKDCYTTLGIVHNLWTPLTSEFDDYIARPKPNAYKSLHTAVIGPDGKPLEVQIRTFEMHQHSEFGVAAHWRYKESGRSDKSGGKFDDKIAWLRQILDWKKDVAGPGGTILEQSETSLFEDTIYVFTPQGKVIDLPKGATPIDFAYAVHSGLGHRCRGAKINGAMVPLSTPLQNGQRVEVSTVKEGGPSRDWLNAELGYVVSHRARTKVRQWFKSLDHDADIVAGRATIEAELKREGFNDKRALNLEEVAREAGISKLDDFFSAVAHGDLNMRQIQHAIRATAKLAEAPVEEDVVVPRQSKATGSGSGILIVGVDKLLTGLGKCCKPAPPDPIIGFVTRGKGITIHRQSCPNISRMKSSSPERMISADWGLPREEVFPVDIEVEAIDRQGLLRDISEVFSREKINVTAVNTLSKNMQARMSFTVEVGSLGQLKKALHVVGEVKGVMSAGRRGFAS